MLASSPDDKKPELNRSTPKSKPSTPVRGSPLRELKTPPSGDKKSPKTKKNQYEEELREFSEWLTTQEKAFHELVGDENLPPTMEALKDRLKQFQVLLGVLGEDSSCRRKCEKNVQFCRISRKPWLRFIKCLRSFRLKERRICDVFSRTE